MAHASLNPAARPVVSVIVPSHPVPMPAGVPAAAWGNKPTLGLAPGQTYLGRITVEVFQDSQQNVVITPTGFRQPQNVQRAVAALQAPGPLPATPALWPDVPITGNAAGGVYLGRAVIELWSSSTKAAVTVARGTAQEIAQRAIQSLGG